MKTAKIPAFPLIVALALFWSVCLHLLTGCLRANGGVFTYTLDDAYIHLAIAKNLANHAVFGITPYQFSSSESSLLWGILLAALYKATPRAAQDALLYAPLALNLIAGSALLTAAWRIARRTRDGYTPLHPALLGFVLAAIVLITPLPWLTFAGMEHLLQALLTLIFVGVAAAFLCHSDDAPVQRRAPLALLALAPLMTAVRYEGAFPVALVCLFLLLRRRWALALGVGGAALLPILIYGAFSAHHGGLWLPNSVVIKSGLGDANIRRDIAQAPQPLWLYQLLPRPYLGLLFGLHVAAVAGRIWARRSRPAPGLWRPSQIHSIVFLACTIANFQTFYQPTTPAICILWFARYHAYLIVLGLVALALQLRDLPAELDRAGDHSAPVHRMVLALAALSGIAGVGARRALETLAVIPQASHNIYEQQWQMAEFVARHYPGQTVVLNDIGAVNYKADIQCLDLVGLGSTDIMRAKYRGGFGQDAIDRIARQRGAKVALVYRAWFEPQELLPKGWTLVAQWTILDNVICGAATVGFYAVDPAEASRLATHIVEFAPRVPPREIEQICFVKVATGRP